MSRDITASLEAEYEPEHTDDGSESFASTCVHGSLACD